VKTDFEPKYRSVPLRTISEYQRVVVLLSFPCSVMPLAAACSLQIKHSINRRRRLFVWSVRSPVVCLQVPVSYNCLMASDSDGISLAAIFTVHPLPSVRLGCNSGARQTWARIGISELPYRSKIIRRIFVYIMPEKLISNQQIENKKPACYGKQ